MKICRGCKKKFEPDNPRQLYCTIRCRDDAHNTRLREAYAKKEKPFTMKICFYCGKSFKSRKGQKFCTGDCAWNNQLLRIRKSSKRKKSLADYNLDESKVCKKTGEKFTFRLYLARKINVEESQVDKVATKKDIAKWYNFFRKTSFHPIVNVPSTLMAIGKKCTYCNKPTKKTRVVYERRWFCDESCYSLYTRFKQIRGSRSLLSGGSKK